jgi:hypothetical protein
MPTTASKRQKEMLRIQRRKEKEAERIRRKEEKGQRREQTAGGEEDPDIAGIIPGPQPRIDEDF